MNFSSSALCNKNLYTSSQASLSSDYIQLVKEAPNLTLSQNGGPVGEAVGHDGKAVREMV